MSTIAFLDDKVSGGMRRVNDNLSLEDYELRFYNPDLEYEIEELLRASFHMPAIIEEECKDLNEKKQETGLD